MLVVFAGRPGTGKTTLSRPVAQALRAALLRVDAVETVIGRTQGSADVGPLGYAVVHEVAAGCLAVGTPVVVDAVNPVPEARRGWQSLPEAAHVQLCMVEVHLTDPEEHRRRAEHREPDLAGQVVPTWQQIVDWQYEPWDEARDGRRRLVDGASPIAVDDVLAYAKSLTATDP